MLSKPIPWWVFAGALLLAAGAGCVNAVGFLGLQHQALTHLSGTVTNLGIEIVRADVPLARHALLVIVFFFLGAVLSGMIVRHQALQLGPRYGVALTLEAVLLFTAAHLSRHGSIAGDYLATMACGLQNAMATSYSGAVIRTTHVTGLITDLGIAVGLAARRERVDGRRMRLSLVLLGGFLVGGVAGAWGFARLAYDTLFIPATVAALVGLGYTGIQHRRNRRAAPRPAIRAR